jgi:D-amino peptidase
LDSPKHEAKEIFWEDENMKLLIAADMEGISGVVSFEQTDPSQPEYQRFRRLMTQDVNAAIQGAWEAGVEEIVVVDGHWNATNIMIEELDHRASLHSGTTAPWAMVQGVENGVDGVIFVGYHARVGTPNAILDHTWSSSRVNNLWLNGRLVGETGLNAAICGAFKAPVLLVTGDAAVCAEADEWLPGVETVAVKKASGRHSAECLPVKTSQKKIHQGSFQAIRLYNENNAPEPLVIPGPVTITVEFIYSDMADRAAVFPGARRLEGRKVEIEAGDVLTAFKGFLALLALASR